MEKWIQLSFGGFARMWRVFVCDSLLPDRPFSVFLTERMLKDMASTFLGFWLVREFFYGILIRRISLFCTRMIWGWVLVYWILVIVSCSIRDGVIHFHILHYAYFVHFLWSQRKINKQREKGHYRVRVAQIVAHGQATGPERIDPRREIVISTKRKKE